MATENQRLTQALQAYSLWADTEPQVLGVLEGGLTNETYLLAVADTKYVLRLNSPADHVWNIDRGVEQKIHQQAAAAGLSEALVYTDLELGYRVSRYQAGKTLAQKDFVEMDWLTSLADLLLKIHALEGAGETINYTDHCQHFLDQLEIDATIKQPLQNAVDQLADISAVLKNQQTVCCHHDLGPYNVLTSEGHLFALDWEYAKLGFAVVDIAIVIDEHQLTKQQIKLLLTHYRKAGGQASKRDLKLVKPIIDLFDLLWNLLYAQLHQKEVDIDLVNAKLKSLQKHLKKSGKVIRKG